MVNFVCPGVGEPPIDPRPLGETRSAPLVGNCGGCGRRYRLRQDGSMRSHQLNQFRLTWNPMKGKRPLRDNSYDKYKEVERVLNAAFVRYLGGDLDFADLLYRVLIINQVRIAEDPKFPYPEERDHYGTTSVIAGWYFRGALPGGAEGITISQYGFLRRAHWGDMDDPWW